MRMSLAYLANVALSTFSSSLSDQGQAWVKAAKARRVREIKQDLIVVGIGKVVVGIGKVVVED